MNYIDGEDQACISKKAKERGELSLSDYLG